MKWIDTVWAQGPLKKLRAMWKASDYFKTEGTEQADFQEFIGPLADLDVPDRCLPSHEDFLRGEEMVRDLITVADRYPKQAQKKGRKRASDDIVQERNSTEKIKRPKKKDDTACNNGEKAEDHTNLYKMFVSERREKVDWIPILLNSNGSKSKQQYPFFIREFFFQEIVNKDIDIPGDRNTFNVILKDIVCKFMQIFQHAPPWELVYAFLGSTTAENGPSIWRQWCETKRRDVPTKQQLRGSNETGRREFRWELWKTAHSRAMDLAGMDLETAAKAGALADDFGSSEEATALCNMYASNSNEGEWRSKVKAKAAEFAEKAWAMKATTEAAAAAADAADDAAAEGAADAADDAAAPAAAATDASASATGTGTAANASESAAELLPSASAATAGNDSGGGSPLGSAATVVAAEPAAVASDRRPLSDLAATALAVGGAANASASAAGASPSSLGSVSGGEL